MSYNYWATKRSIGWAVEKEGASMATSVHETRETAWLEAGDLLVDQGAKRCSKIGTEGS
ncbi:DUF2188 domain-containing protein [Kaistia sp. MMO-174]|uniref:DUF2188 domain-containing protein n=1 Tax=Kaistia sp. MMO-174 TaxID=3081256 RepID=UPI003FA61474